MKRQNHVVIGITSMIIPYDVLNIIENTKLKNIKLLSDTAILIKSYMFNNMHDMILYTAIALFFVTIGSTLPDIDQKPKLRKYIDHRTWTHTIYPVLLILALTRFFEPLVWLAYAYFVHLLCDNLSIMGVCFLNPYGYKKTSKGGKVKRNHRGIYRYNSYAETLTAICIILFIIVLTLLCEKYKIISLQNFLKTFKQ